MVKRPCFYCGNEKEHENKDFKVICDETNNSEEDKENNILNVDILITHKNYS